MTLEEAIKLLKQYQGYEPISPDGETLKHAFDLTDETVDTLLTALRTPTREQVEKMRGEWTENKDVAIESAICSKCKTVFQAYYGNYQFCPRCGAPMTDEAVEMVMERLEALKDGKDD